jgi:hypothetical protein
MEQNKQIKEIGVYLCSDELIGIFWIENSDISIEK